MTRSFYVSVFTGAALATMMIMAPSAMASPRAATPSPTPSPNSQVPVQQGTDVASLPGATAFGDTPPGTPETVSFILRERNLPQLKAAVQHGVRNFLSVGQFAATYGQTQANLAQLTGYLAKFGISTQVYADNVDVVANGTAGERPRPPEHEPAGGGLRRVAG
jgi:hypothetical protein